MSVESLLSHAADISLKTLFRVVALCVLAGLISLVLWISLLPQLLLCTESALKCVGVVFVVLYLALICPLLLLWGARGYLVFSVLFQLRSALEKPLVTFCAQQLCAHRASILAANKISPQQWEARVPAVLRSVINRLDLKALRPVLENQDVTPADLEGPLRKSFEAQFPLKKPSFAWYWLLLGSMFGSAAVVWFWF